VKSCFLSFSQAISSSSGSTSALYTIVFLLTIFSLVEEVSAEITTGSALTASVKVNSPNILARLLLIALMNLKNEFLLNVLHIVLTLP
jgi:hypothetical protein